MSTAVIVNITSLWVGFLCLSWLCVHHLREIRQIRSDTIQALRSIRQELSQHHVELHELNVIVQGSRRSTAEDLANLWKRVRYNNDGISTLHDGAGLLRDKQQRLEQQLADAVTSLSESMESIGRSVSRLESTIKPSARFGRKG